MSSILQIKDASGNWVAIPSITGPEGPPGPRGEPGPQGEPGEMSASIYDPQGKKQDIFAYIDAAITGAIEGSY